MAILNLQPLTPKTPEEKLLEGVPGLNISALPSGIDFTPPPPNVPRFRGYGDFLAQRGGFAPEDLRTREELMGMTQAEVDEYQRQRRQARRAGIGETLLRVGQAFQGKDATALAMQREQARQQAELQRGYQEQYQSAIQAAEQVDPGKAALLRSLGLPGWLNLQQKQAEQMFLGGERENVELYELVDENNNFLRNITEDEYMDAKANKTLPKGSKLKRLPTSTEASKTVKADDVSDFIKPLESRYDSTIQLANAIQGAADQIYKEPTAALAVGNLAQFADAVVQNINALTGGLDNANDNEYYQEMLQGVYIAEDTGKDFTQTIKRISGGNAVLESKIRDLAYLFAAARGQEGRGLSDKDYENALRIVSGGVGAEGRVAVLQDVSTRIKDDIVGTLQRKKARLEFRANQKGVDNTLYKKYINEIDSLFTTEIPTFVNPFLQQQTPIVTTPTSNIDAILAKYPPQG